MLGSIKRKIARITGSNIYLNKEIMCLRRSLIEINQILNCLNKGKKRKK